MLGVGRRDIIERAECSCEEQQWRGWGGDGEGLGRVRRSVGSCHSGVTAQTRQCEGRHEVVGGCTQQHKEGGDELFLWIMKRCRQLSRGAEGRLAGGIRRG